MPARTDRHENMAGYDTSYDTVTMAGAPNHERGEVLRLTAPDNNDILSIGMDSFDHDLSFDGDSLL